MQQLLTRRELRDILKISDSTLTRWIKAGKVPASRTINGLPRWDRETIETWLEGQSRG